MSDLKTSNLNDLETRLLAEVSTDHLWEHAATLAQWVKISGTPGERSAVAYLASQLRSYGLATTIHEFDSLLGWPEEAELKVRSGGGRDIRTITHSLAPSSPEGGLEGDVVYVGAGEESDFANAGLAGKIGLVEGIAAPVKVLRGVRSRAAALIFIQEDRLHEMCVSPVWGTPTTRSAENLANMPVVSILREDGDRLKADAAQGALRVWLRTKTFLGWRPTPLVVGELRGSVEPEKFVLFSGHHCSWYYGAMDNGTANATMLEVARILADHRQDLRRSVRVVFWPGHTQARYSGSTWYFDQFWEDLHDNCVLHVNADSTGARGADIYKALSMPETTDFAIRAIRDAIGEEAQPERQSRAGDQSFWGCGVPSVFMDLSQVPIEMAARASSGSLFKAADEPAAPATTGHHRPGGLPWWWHTPDDTIDKIDREVLHKDTDAYLLTTLRAANEAVLPFRYQPAAVQIREAIERYQAAAGGRFDLGPALRRAQEVETRTAEVDRLVEQARSRDLDAGGAATLNSRLMAIDRELVMINFTANGPFDQDLAVPIPAVPLLEPARRLADLDPDSNQARYLVTELTRNRNKVAYHLRLAAEAAEIAVSVLQETVV